MKESVGQYLSGLMETELTRFLGRAPYPRAEQDSNHRNGSYRRSFTMKGIGKVRVRVPRDRQGQFSTQVIPRCQRYEKALQEDLCLVFLSGVSTRTLSLISEKLIGRRVSPEEVSKASEKLVEAVEAWRQRDLSREPIKYMYIDGTLFRMRVAKEVNKVPVLVAIGVTASGHRTVLGLQSGDKESAVSWREFFKDLKGRGLDASQVILGSMDGLPGLEKVFSEE